MMAHMGRSIPSQSSFSEPLIRPAGHRSPVPDLLYEEVQQARLAELGPLRHRPEEASAATPLHRVTVFLTYRCNLACPYCKTIPRGAADLVAAPQKRLAHDLASFTRLLDGWSGTPLRHLHFTGGEPLLCADLPAMLSLARRRGVEHLSVTSNGTLPPPRALALVEAGLDELRLSIDADDAAAGAALTGREAAWSASLATLRAVAAARRAGVGTFLVINTVVTRANRERLPSLVRFLLGFGPDDLKLITDVDDRLELGRFPAAARVRGELDALLAARPPGALPLLRRKLETVFDPEAIGLDGPAPPGAAPWRCLIPLTERTVDAVAYYPCSVYLREGGRPLGPLGDGAAAQRAASARFVRDSDCRTDPLCRRFCLTCTRRFNDRAAGVAP
jgi:pyruvate-formate lyase-activating enzyme